MSNCKGIYLDCRGTAAALVGEEPPLNMGWSERNIFAADTTDLHPANAAAEGILYSVSSSYLAHCRDSVVDRPGFHRARRQSGTPVAIVNEHFARKLFGSPQDALGRSFKARDGVRRQIVGVVEDGKYTANIAEDPRLAMFFPIVQAPSPATWLVVRSDRDPQEMGGAIRQLVHNIDPGLPVFVQTWQKEMNGALFASRMLRSLSECWASWVPCSPSPASSGWLRIRCHGACANSGSASRWERSGRKCFKPRSDRAPTLGNRIGHRIHRGSSRQPHIVRDRLSGDAARSHRARRCCGRHAVARTPGNVRPGTTCIVLRSRSTLARGMIARRPGPKACWDCKQSRSAVRTAFVTRLRSPIPRSTVKRP